eukprot:24277_1
MLSFHSLVIIHHFVLAFLVITWSFNCHEFVCHNTFRSEFKVINFQSIEYDQNVFIDSYHSISMRGCKRQLCRLLCITSSSEPCYLCQNTETCDDHRNWCSKSGTFLVLLLLFLWNIGDFLLKGKNIEKK